jgi:hypothetical protein
MGRDGRGWGSERRLWDAFGSVEGGVGWRESLEVIGLGHDGSVEAGEQP